MTESARRGRSRSPARSYSSRSSDSFSSSSCSTCSSWSSDEEGRDCSANYDFGPRYDPAAFDAMSAQEQNQFIAQQRQANRRNVLLLERRRGSLIKQAHHNIKIQRRSVKKEMRQLRLSLYAAPLRELAPAKKAVPPSAQPTTPQKKLPPQLPPKPPPRLPSPRRAPPPYKMTPKRNRSVSPPRNSGYRIRTKSPPRQYQQQSLRNNNNNNDRRERERRFSGVGRFNSNSNSNRTDEEFQRQQDAYMSGVKRIVVHAQTNQDDANEAGEAGELAGAGNVVVRMEEIDPEDLPLNISLKKGPYNPSSSITVSNNGRNNINEPDPDDVPCYSSLSEGDK